ncbi:hypothetical protein [Thalassobellus suaedae]|uniref:Uncharacterized protein n=1 Tax=Thalassobellus suaedae TaxID=3074124 RepID=A0ABY9XUS4_9FLAO|nr:hypothetical protein RHP51_01195 [Flavobacteriaceae bacterium HL-DH14]
MNSNLKLIALFLGITLLSCKNENTLTEFKYSEKPIALTCSDINSKLYNEALYSFEDDILTFYSKDKPNFSLIQAYSQFIRNATYGSVKYEEIISEHTSNIFKALKQDNDLWDANNTKSHLNYNSKLIKCIADNIKDENLKTTFNALISTNSMSPKLFGAPLNTKYRNVLSDKFLASYVAFDLFYANLFNIDFSKVNFDKPTEKVDFNKIPQK